MALTATGIGTGLDINNLVSQLVKAEGQPATTALNRREQSLNTRLSALGTLKGALSSFQTAFAKLNELSTFSARRTTNANEAAFSVSAGSAAAVGSYSVEVMQLAKAQKLASSGFTDANTTVGSGSLTLSVGGSAFSVAIGAGTTLAGIRDVINQATDNTGVSASIVNVDDGMGGTTSRLILTAQQTGTANAIGVTINDDDGNNTDAAGLSALAFTEQTAAQDAVMRVDGYTITRSSNTISDAVDGLTFTLKDVATSPSQVGVETDTAQIESTLKSFVDGYNKLRQTMTDLGKYDPDTKKAGALQGDALLRDLQQSLRRDLTDPVASLTEPLNALSGFGIEIDRYGVMSLDSTKFKSAIESSSSALAQLSDLFVASDGVYTRAKGRLDSMLSSDGVLESQVSRLNAQKRTISDQRAQLEARLARVEAQLFKQFNAMDRIVAQFNSTGSYLTQQLANLPGAG
ncbi:MAG: flagellar filament capping protein FliD [Pseudomonadota bacterium]